VLLRRVLGLDYAEIGRKLDKSEGAVRNLVYRGVARLAELTRGGDDKQA
jgi:DNA-directed RNA polymerase specialized sigma24 family protein